MRKDTTDFHSWKHRGQREMRLPSSRKVCTPTPRRRWPRCLFGAALLALTGCAGHVRYASIYCLSQKQFAEIQKAEPPKVGNKLDGNAQDDLKTIAGSAIELRQYDGDLLNVLGGCVEPVK